MIKKKKRTVGEVSPGVTLIRIVKHSLSLFIHWFIFFHQQSKTIFSSEKRVIAHILPLGKDLTLKNTDTQLHNQKVNYKHMKKKMQRQVEVLKK